MIDHIGISVEDYEGAKAFYLAALAPLGYKLVMEYPGVAGLGADNKPDFWIAKGERTKPRMHLCFEAKSRKIVEEFYQAAIAAGGTDNGKPGIRAEYHPNYYGAFVIDPEGHNLEACKHSPE